MTRAWWFFVMIRMSFSGLGAAWGSGINCSYRGMAGECSCWLTALDGLPAIHARLQRVQVDCADWRVILERYDTPDTLFYLDPPYVLSSRKDGGYPHELSDKDHRDLVEQIQRLQGYVVLSAYPCEIYEPLAAAGWEKIEIKTSCYAVGRTRQSGLQGDGKVRTSQYRTEVVWRSKNVGIKLKQEKSDMQNGYSFSMS